MRPGAQVRSLRRLAAARAHDGHTSPAVVRLSSNRSGRLMPAPRRSIQHRPADSKRSSWPRRQRKTRREVGVAKRRVSRRQLAQRKEATHCVVGLLPPSRSASMLASAGVARASTVGTMRLVLASQATVADPDWTAANNSVVILQAWDIDTLYALKAANPSVNVLMYQNASAASSSSANGVYPSGVSVRSSSGEWLVAREHQRHHLLVQRIPRGFTRPTSARPRIKTHGRPTWSRSCSRLPGTACSWTTSTRRSNGITA